MSAALTPAQEAQVRAIVAEMVGQALRGAQRRVEDAVAEAVLRSSTGADHD